MVIAGLQDSFFGAKTFEAELFLPEYAMEAPEVYSAAINEHTNLVKLGRIHLDVLKGKRSLALSIHTILLLLPL